MSRVITFSTQFPSYHPRKGEPTFFVEKIYNSIYSVHDWSDAPGTTGDYVTELDPTIREAKQHTIRAGKRWQVGDKFSPRIWSGKPYHSKQIIIAPDIEIKKVWDFEIKHDQFFINDCNAKLDLNDIAANDGLLYSDFFHWFQFPKPFDGQIICWNENINYK